jgi:epsilon-lactone hydrolase
MSMQQLKRILEISAENPPPENATPDMLRAWLEDATSQLPVAENVKIKRVKCGPCEGDLILAEGGDDSRLIIHYHGGGFVIGSSRTHRVIASNLARAAGSAVLVPDYRLAPENPAPAAHDDAFAVYQWALSQGYTPERVALSGDSVGGNLALATVVRAKEAGLALPSSLTLASPWLDLAREGASYQEVPDDPILSTELLNLLTSSFLGVGDRKSTKVTPFYSDFSGLPPTLVHVGSWERLRDDSITVVARMKAVGVAAELKIFDGMIHGWQLYAPMLDDGMVSIEECAAFIRAHQV